MSKKTKGLQRVQVGYETYMNTKTGEVLEMPKLAIKGGDINFQKAWIWHLCDAYKFIGNKSVDILNFLFQERDSSNLIIASHVEIANKTETSEATVNRVMKKLKDHNILTMPKKGVYRINPDIIWKGSHQGRMHVLVEYENEKRQENPKEISPELEKKRLVEQMNAMQEQMDLLEKKLSAFDNLTDEDISIPAAE